MERLHHTQAAQAYRNGGNPEVQDLDTLVGQLPEDELWPLLNEIVERQLRLRNDTVMGLDANMQGFLFLQEFVENRTARINFVRSPRHMSYLRDAAGSRNVWMSDAEFSELVGQNESNALACFARNDRMKPHHLMYIEYLLSVRPHGDSMLANADDTRITFKKALETQGADAQLALMRLAMAAMAGVTRIDGFVEEHSPAAQLYHCGDPRALWQAYQNLKSVDRELVRQLLNELDESSIGLVRTSGQGGGSVH